MLIDSLCVATFIKCLAEKRLLSHDIYVPAFKEMRTDEFISKVVKHLEEENMMEDFILSEEESFGDVANGVLIKKVGDKYLNIHIERFLPFYDDPVSLKEALFSYVSGMILTYFNRFPPKPSYPDNTWFWFAENKEGKSFFYYAEKIESASSRSEIWRPLVCNVLFGDKS